MLSLRIWLAGVPILVGLMLYQPSPMLFLIAILAVPHALGAWRLGKQSGPPGYYVVAQKTMFEYAVLYLGLMALLAR